jgi:hypothetical protein
MERRSGGQPQIRDRHCWFGFEHSRDPAGIQDKHRRIERRIQDRHRRI